MKKVTAKQAEFVLDEVAKWLGKKGMGVPKCKAGHELNWIFEHVDDGEFCGEIEFGPAPTGSAAAYSGEGPELNMEWDWPGQPTPTVILESGYAPEEWAVSCSFAIQDAINAKGYPISVEPYSSYALSIYPN